MGSRNSDNAGESPFSSAAGRIPLDPRSLKLRRDIVGVLAAARRGHVGGAFSLVEMLRVLYDDVLRQRPSEPHWPDRDRFILSKGHGCLALYVLLAEKGFFSADELRRFCMFGGILGGHPDGRKIPGVEVSTGSLGHGLSLAVGMAMGLRMSRLPARVFVVLGDGECNEGSVWEGALSAAQHGLGALTVLVDYNKMQSYGEVRDILALEPFAAKWADFGFDVAEVNGHDVDALRRELNSRTPEGRRPKAVICHTVKGKGAAFAEGNPAWHHKSRFSDGDISALMAALEDSACAKPA